MKTNFLVIFAILILSSTVIITPASADIKIVINEVEANPSGTDTGNEWVELYNPSSNAVDISGWTISTTHGDTVTVSIPSGTTIAAHGYRLVTYGSLWLDNEDESIVLRNASGSEVDRTPILSDTYNDERSWQRYPNGVDTDSTSDWRFTHSTNGLSNGGEQVPSPTPTPTPTPAPSIPTGLGNVTVYFIDVGQGDSIFVDTNGKDVLIDGGERTAGQAVVNYLRYLNITKIDIVVGTHQHADHIGGLITVMQTFPVSTVYDNGAVKTTQTYQDYINLARQRSLITAERGQSIQLDNMTFMTVLNPEQPLEFDDENDNSIVIKMEVNSVSFLFAGDAEEPAEQSILLAGFNLTSTVLKIGHHGSRTATTQNFLDAVNPEVAVISVGEGNSYGHPHQETLTKLATKNIDTYRTDLDGTITITTNGTDYTVTTEKTHFITTTRIPSSMAVSISVASIDKGQSVTVSGSISPPISGAAVTLSYKNGEHVDRPVVASSDGSFQDTYTPKSGGSYTVTASWEGDENYEGATSAPVAFEVVDKGCIIATSSYGSELAPEVQFLRGFRENIVYSTFAGSSFMAVFNPFYYSWSPMIAGHIWGNDILQSIGRALIYPLIGILHLATDVFSLFEFNSELGVVIAGLTASSLIGLVYFFPLTLIPLAFARKYRRSVPNVSRLKPLLSPWFLGLGLIALAEASSSSIIMMLGTGMFVVFTIALTTGALALMTIQFYKPK